MAATAEQTSKSTETAPEIKKGRLGKFVKIGGILLGIVVTECAVAFLYLPSSNVEAAKPASAEMEFLPPELKDEPPAADAACREFNMGEFRVTAYQPISNTTLRIDFHMFGMVLAGKDEEELAEQFKAKEKRLRDQVFVTVRGADLNDLTDAGLGLLKRRILETTNKTLGKPLVQSVVFSDFSFVEQ